MSLALFEFFWDWSNPTPNPTTASAATADSGAGGGHSKEDYYPIDWDELWALREAYLRSLNDNPIARQRAIEKNADAGWPDAILKPRRKRS